MRLIILALFNPPPLLLLSNKLSTQQVVKEVIAGNHVSLTTDMQEVCGSIFAACFCVEPTRRPTFVQLQSMLQTVSQALLAAGNQALNTRLAPQVSSTSGLMPAQAALSSPYFVFQNPGSRAQSPMTPTYTSAEQPMSPGVHVVEI